MPDPSLPACRLEVDPRGREPDRLLHACAPCDSGTVLVAGDRDALHAIFLGDTAEQAIAQLRDAYRVIRRDGSIRGYRWGPERRRALLGSEHGARGVAPPGPDR
ncbi:MAG: MGMT family protein [Burkholderiaceae bacterium]